MQRKLQKGECAAASGGRCINIGSQFPATTGDLSIPAQSVAYYCLTVDKNVAAIVVAMDSRDWETNSDVFVGNVSNPTLSDINAIIASGNILNRGSTPIWYNINGTSNERVYVMKASNVGDRYYITVFNRASKTSKIKLYWQGY